MTPHQKLGRDAGRKNSRRQMHAQLPPIRGESARLFAAFYCQSANKLHLWHDDAEGDRIDISRGRRLTGC